MKEPVFALRGTIVHTPTPKAFEILEDGYAGVFTTELNGKKVLRMCILNPATTNDDIRETLQLLDHYYAELMEAPERKSHIA